MTELLVKLAVRFGVFLLVFAFAAWKIRSMFATVRFSVTLAPTLAQFAPFSLSTSFCGSMNTSAVSVL